ncbi:hypothetical protein ABZ702_20475 [Streptomyces cyaneofuscatus]
MNPRRTVELDASHASLASQPQAVVDLIEDAVRETAGWQLPGGARST